MTRADCVIVGGGLAGTALAWHLLWRGRLVLLLDRPDPAAASRVAAGLLTPVTGGRFGRTWRWDEFRPAAGTFYRQAEAETGGSFFTEREAVRLFHDAADRAECDRRAGPQPEAMVNHDWFAAPAGGFALPDAARLDAAAYLDASHRHFARLGMFAAAALDPAGDVDLAAGRVRLPRLGVAADALVFCQGAGAAGNPWFPRLPLTPNAGEVLTLHVPGLAEDRVVTQAAWLAPLGDERFLAGATSAPGRADVAPTAAGRGELCDRVRAFLRLPFEVVGHRAGVRPTTPDRRPLVGFHPAHPQLACFTGLGSKGALTAPLIAGQLAARLCGDGAIDPAVDLGRFAGR